jgi:hypothetical protein
MTCPWASEADNSVTTNPNDARSERIKPPFDFANRTYIAQRQFDWSPFFYGRSRFVRRPGSSSK